MHELAHCQQMNHSRNFWKARNKFADELRELWTKGYTGDGLFGRGQSLYSGQYTEEAAPAVDDSPEHLCGGVYRSGGGKRGRKAGANTSQLTYAEKKQRRIEKKFGKGGVSLGGNEDGRVKLENGKKPKGKPRVAGSVRGRELRAAAALARFETPGKDLQVDDDDETASEDDYDEPTIKIEAMDGDGNTILNDKGKSFVKVCGDEDPEDDDGARQEMAELGSFAKARSTEPEPEPKPKKRIMTTINKSSTRTKNAGRQSAKAQQTTVPSEGYSTAKSASERKKIYNDESTESEAETEAPAIKVPVTLIDDEETASEAEEGSGSRKQRHSTTGPAMKAASEDRSDSTRHEPVSSTTSSDQGLITIAPAGLIDPDDAAPKFPAAPAETDASFVAVSTPPVSTTTVATTVANSGICPICSLENDLDALKCAVCSHVLAPSSLPGCWPCQSEGCKRLGYLNVGDNGICGLCGAPKA